MKVIVAGSRSIQNLTLVFEKLDLILGEVDTKGEIVTGKAKGPDTLGAMWGMSRGWLITPFPADWVTHGKRAGYLRNQEMANYGTHLIAFWDGESKGTMHMIDLARTAGLEVRIVRVEQHERTRT